MILDNDQAAAVYQILKPGDERGMCVDIAAGPYSALLWCGLIKISQTNAEHGVYEQYESLFDFATAYGLEAA